MRKVNTRVKEAYNLPLPEGGDFFNLSKYNSPLSWKEGCPKGGVVGLLHFLSSFTLRFFYFFVTCRAISHKLDIWRGFYLKIQGRAIRIFLPSVQGHTVPTVSL
jgi:hypothetical protein